MILLERNMKSLLSAGNRNAEFRLGRATAPFLLDSLLCHKSEIGM